MADQPIAVIGLACRVPGADSPAQLWQLLLAGRDEIVPVPAERTRLVAGLAAAGVRPGGGAGGWGGFVADLDAFEPELFGIAATEAGSLDPQQRMLLELAWSATEHASLPVAALSGTRTGVYVGQTAQDMAMLVGGRPAEQVGPYTNTGMCAAVTANRLSYLWDLRGPSVTLDTACSASLVAVHLAVRGLLGDECDLALAGGVNVLLAPEPQLGALRMTALAEDGRCRSFAAGAGGYVRSEGGGVVLLKRLADALADGDPVLAVIAGSAVGQDGRTNGLTAPSGRGQAEVIRRALDRAGIDGSQVGYVEAHGTGTPLGDPIEARALVTALGPRPVPVSIGSVKANLGHLEAAAGVLGLIKAVLMVGTRTVPPQPNFDALNPRIDADRVRVAREPAGWPLPSPAVVGVSSFGFGGTNAHVLVRQASAAGAGPLSDEQSDEQSDAVSDAPSNWVSGELSDTVSDAVAGVVSDVVPVLLALSARSAAGLGALAGEWAALIARTPSWQEVRALIAAAGALRPPAGHRRAVVAADRAELTARLAEPAGLTGLAGPVPPSRPVPSTGEPVFVYSGHGPEPVAGARRLMAGDPVFAARVRRRAAELAPELGWNPEPVLAGSRELPPGDLPAQAVTLLVQLALTDALAAAGIMPGAVVGHSMGELAAAVAAGKLTASSAARVLVLRCRAVAAVPGGLLAVAAGADEVRRLLDRPTIAAVNSPGAVVLAGTRAELEHAAERLAAAGLDARRLPAGYPSHSPAMAAPAAELAAALGSLPVDAPPVGAARCRFFSTVLAADATELELSADYWAANLAQPVRFADTVAELLATGAGHFVEISPHPILTAPVAECAADAVVLPSLSRDAEYRHGCTELAGALFEAGIDPVRQFAGSWRQLAPRLPATPFARRPLATPGIDRSADHAGAEPEPVADRASGALAAALAASSDRAAALGQVSATLARLLADVLPGRPDAAGVQFADLGLDSLRAVALRRALEREVGEPVPVTLFWAHPSPAELAEALTDRLYRPADDGLTQLLALLDGRAG